MDQKKILLVCHLRRKQELRNQTNIIMLIKVKNVSKLHISVTSVSTLNKIIYIYLYREIQVIYKSDIPNAIEALWISLAPKILKIK